MGNGGIIPTSKTQTVTFFNTTGLIERGKNMYFAPRLSKTLATAGQKLSIAYLNEFKRVCPPFSDYSDMDISGWSPEDRTLVINGNIDDFRLITEVGNCLNYLIITRQVTTNNTTKTYYYSFFITGVTQVGKNSVRVTIEPDDFTNVFYLHNEKVLTSGDITGDYEPFNDKMKNCYVNRQHYNRVKQVNETDYVIDCYINPDRYFDIADGTQITLEFQDGDPYEPVVITGTVVSHLWTSETSPYRLRISIGFFESEIDINDPDNFSTGHYGSTNFIFDYNTDDIVWYPDKPRHLDIDNIKIFLNQPESFKFKYQYRDSKYPLSLFQDNGYVSFSQEEKRIISITDSFSDLPDDLKHKIVNASVNCIAVEFKSCEIIAPYVFQRGDQLNKYTAVRYMSGGLVSEQVERPTPVIMFPFFNIPKEFKKYEEEMISYEVFGQRMRRHFNYEFKVNVSNGNTTSSLTTSVYTDIISVFERLLSNSAYGEYISGAFIIPYFPIGKIYIDVNHYKIIVEDYNVYTNNTDSDYAYKEYKSGTYLAYIMPEQHIGYDYKNKTADDVYNDDIGPHITASMENPTYSDPVNSICGLLISNREFPIMKVKIEESIPNLKVASYDPVLEAEPYSFYSISFVSSNELIFNKNRYYTGLESDIKFTFYVSVNGGVKYGLIPKYELHNTESEYYNEGISTIMVSTLPVVSDSYLTYYYQNMAQMKNQFAVNDYNRRTDLLQHFFITGPANVGKGFIKGGKAGGYSALIGELADMSNETIDWAQSNKVIEMNQRAVLADVGRKPDSLKSAGSDVYYDLSTKENHLFMNHYTIDSVSYISIAKYLERFGYNVSLYSTLNTMNRVGYNFVQLTSFDWVIDNTNKVMVSQQESIKSIFQEGVTLVHDKSYLTSGHNYETILE